MRMTYLIRNAILCLPYQNELTFSNHSLSENQRYFYSLPPFPVNFFFIPFFLFLTLSHASQPFLLALFVMVAPLSATNSFFLSSLVFFLSLFSCSPLFPKIGRASCRE